MCAPSELICQSGCIYVGTNEAQALYQAILDCAFETCGPSPTWECYDGAITNECAVSYTACLDD